MIIPVNGKRIAFGLEWTPLVSSGSPASLAAQQAALHKSRLMWHDGRALYVGLLAEAERQSGNTGATYAAAEAFLRTPGLPADALLVLRTGRDSYSIVGIKDKRPCRGFDRTGLSESDARDLYQKFGRRCGEQGFVVVGDPSTPFAEKITPLTIVELAGQADDHCALKAPSNSGGVRLAIRAAAVLVVGVIFGPTLYHQFVAPPPPPQTELTPEQQYQQAIAQHQSDPVMLATDYHGWLAWRRSLSPQYGGWRLEKIDCDFANPASQPASYVSWDGTASCTLSFERSVPVATNETFVAAAPADWLPSMVYKPSSDRITVALRPHVAQPVMLGAVLKNAATGGVRDIHFVSQLQHIGMLAKEPTMTAPTPFLVPPALPQGSVAGPYMVAGWSFNGASHYIDLLDRFPPYATLSKAVISISKTATGDETPISVALAGQVITRN